MGGSQQKFSINRMEAEAAEAAAAASQRRDLDCKKNREDRPRNGKIQGTKKIIPESGKAIAKTNVCENHRKKSNSHKLAPLLGASSAELETPNSGRLSIDSQTKSSQIPNALVAMGYDLHQQIGYGGFSTVYIASNRHLPGVKFACKVFSLNAINKQWTAKFLKNELRITTKLRHRNIVRAYDSYKTRTKAYIFMAFLRNGNMDAYLARHPETGCRVREPIGRRWAYGLACGVDYLHRHNIAHRDLKLDNFLLDDNLEPLISDFSFSVLADGPIAVSEADIAIMCSTICGTALYLAPEIRLIGEDQSKTQYEAKKTDMYALGVCVYEMLHGYKPYEGEYTIKSKELVARQMANDYVFAANLRLSAKCRQLIRSMLEPKPMLRVKASQMMAHAWFDTLKQQQQQQPLPHSPLTSSFGQKSS